jgi:chemotaxis protein methyltransferase CheR
MSSDQGRRHQFSMQNTESFPLPDVHFLLLRDLIVERTGVLFDDAKRGLLIDKLSTVILERGLTSFLDYYYLLRYDDASEGHLAELMNRLSVPETYFWRQAEQIEALAAIVAPAHFAMQPGKTFRIWSAACCTGEEPVSLAMALAEVGLLGSHPIEIVATDGSGAMVERARLGMYGERSFRQLPAPLREKYFEKDGERWRPIERLRRAITWDVVNLAQTTEVERYSAVDVIFCRNVFIYFSDDAIRRVVRVFSDRMANDGYIFLGAAESLTRLGVDLELAEIGKAFAYVKEGRRQIVERASRIPRAQVTSAAVSPPPRD